MSRELPQITLQQRQMMMTVIWLALIMGVVTFGMIVTFIGLKEEPGKGLPVITYLGMGLAALMLVLRMIIPNMIARNQFTQAMQEAREEGNQDEEQMLGTFYQIFMVRMIIGLALLEGAAMINLVAVMVENQKLAFIPVAILLLVMIASMPTKSKLDGWIRNQMENYNLEHQN
ncbi:hypothetical protein [Gimesia maris]|uniref:hypothetical protein n=1 Tax=Gimesia maris TaxID=122 RepID=UPI000E88F746|nr:hypothetical protein [Gimesia maris]QDT81421.1 hypothetical protein Mal35_49020 [Gimesia maris]HAW26502.1 hypothetical protein [Planctomycetaceae bacterium]|tara:strand:+ start:579 stop:1097 length:519 start_codon:yes stop_codon:yes gene_type:complete